MNSKKRLLIIVLLLAILFGTGAFFFLRRNNELKNPEQFAGQFLAELKAADSEASFKKLSSDIQSFHGSKENFNKLFVEPLRAEDNLDRCEPTAVAEDSTFAYICPRQNSDNRDIILITITNEKGKLKVSKLSRDGYKRFQATQQPAK